jgi:hypothetical protein
MFLIVREVNHLPGTRELESTSLSHDQVFCLLARTSEYQHKKLLEWMIVASDRPWSWIDIPVIPVGYSDGDLDGLV